MTYSIVLYNENDHHDDLIKFTQQAELDGIENNSSIKKLSLKTESGLFLTYHDNKIVAMAHTHDFSQYYPGAWRIFARTATLKEYRAKGFPRRRGLVSCSGLNSHTVPYQVDYAKERGAKFILWTTNVSGEGLGYAGSAKLDRHFKICEDADPTYSFYDEAEIYGVRQSVWKLNYRDILNVEGKLD